MKCSNCNSEFSRAQIKEKKQGLVSPTVKCPEYSTWLEKDKLSSTIQLVGIGAWLLGMLGNFEYILLNITLSLSLFIAGFVVFLFSFKISIWQASE